MRIAATTKSHAMVVLQVRCGSRGQIWGRGQWERGGLGIWPLDVTFPAGEPGVCIQLCTVTSGDCWQRYCASGCSIVSCAVAAGIWFDELAALSLTWSCVPRAADGPASKASSS